MLHGGTSQRAGFDEFMTALPNRAERLVKAVEALTNDNDTQLGMIATELSDVAAAGHAIAEGLNNIAAAIREAG